MSGNNTIGDYSLYTGLISQLMLGLSISINASMTIYEDKLRIDTITNFQKRRNTVLNDGAERLKVPVSIVFNNVSFRYPNTSLLILSQVSFSIGPGEKVCLVGANGAGKSTIIKLLMRFYDPTEGEILLNGKNICRYDLDDLRRNLSIIFQEQVNFAFSIRENITVADNLIEKDIDLKILEAFRQSGFETVLSRAPNGLDTYIYKYFDEDGIVLSGGENQKLALARALYRDCSIIIFDEPTAALDPEAECNFFDNMKNLCHNKTTLFTSHRLSAVHLADRILFLEKGRVIEDGTHSTLMKRNGKYARMYRLQADKYADDLRTPKEDVIR